MFQRFFVFPSNILFFASSTRVQISWTGRKLVDFGSLSNKVLIGCSWRHFIYQICCFFCTVNFLLINGDSTCISILCHLWFLKVDNETLFCLPAELRGGSLPLLYELFWFVWSNHYYIRSDHALVCGLLVLTTQN